jgi:hypothetical protein
VISRGEFRMAFGEDLPRDIRMRRKRRGLRMNSHVPVAIEWNGRAGPAHFESGFTRVVNGYGCLLVSPKEIDVQQKVKLTNLSSREAVSGVVVWKGDRQADGWELGVELVSPEMGFWGIDF